jgi:hypothetical protein
MWPKKIQFSKHLAIWNQTDYFSKEPNSGSKPALIFRTRIETRIEVFIFLGKNQTRNQIKFLVLFMCETTTKDSYNLFSRNQSSGGSSS